MPPSHLLIARACVRARRLQKPGTGFLQASKAFNDSLNTACGEDWEGAGQANDHALVHMACARAVWPAAAAPAATSSGRVRCDPAFMPYRVHTQNSQDMQMYIDSFKETMDKEVMEQLKSYVNMFGEHKVSAPSPAAHNVTGAWSPARPRSAEHLCWRLIAAEASTAVLFLVSPIPQYFLFVRPPHTTLVV